jgi:hypothetical protein
MKKHEASDNNNDITVPHAERNEKDISFSRLTGPNALGLLPFQLWSNTTEALGLYRFTRVLVKLTSFYNP